MTSTPGHGHQPPGDEDDILPSERPAWLPETPHSRAQAAIAASYSLTPPAILACYDWRLGDCFMCREQDRFVTVIGVRGDEDDGEDAVPLTICGSCVLAQEEKRRARMIRQGRPYVPGGIGQPE